jgi:hypothetical protein
LASFSLPIASHRPWCQYQRCVIDSGLDNALAPSHAESGAKCEYAICKKSGLAVLYGDVGTGKTTILNELKRRFTDQSYTIAVLNNPNQASDTALLMRSTRHLVDSTAFRHSGTAPWYNSRTVEAGQSAGLRLFPIRG